MSTAVLQTRDLRKHYRGRAVVNGVSFSVEEGEIFGLLGPNGAGKTTTFNLIVGRVRADAGEVSLDGERITRLPMFQRARRGLGYLPQESSIFRKLSVRDNFLAIMEVCGVPRTERAGRCDHLLKEFDLERLQANLGGTLSGGERRRVEVARCLIPEPRVVLFDEPFAGVDPIAVHELQGLIQALRERSIAVLITDHNVRETLQICHRASILAEGKVVITGTPDEIASNTEARSVYLGQDFHLDSNQNNSRRSDRANPASSATH